MKWTRWLRKKVMKMNTRGLYTALHVWTKNGFGRGINMSAFIRTRGRGSCWKKAEEHIGMVRYINLFLSVFNVYCNIFMYFQWFCQTQLEEWMNETAPIGSPAIVVATPNGRTRVKTLSWIGTNVPTSKGCGIKAWWTCPYRELNLPPAWTCTSEDTRTLQNLVVP